MKFHSIILGAILLGCAAAGGIRGAYERLFIWYAYRAEIEFLGSDGLDNLVICRDGFGNGPDSTLTFNEFIEYTNRAPGATPGRITPIVNDNNLRPNVDQTAGTLYNRRYITPRWNDPSRIVTGTRGYTAMLRAVATRFNEVKGQIPANNEAITRAIDALEKVALSREIDYERFRMPAMEAAPEFTGQNKVTFATWNVQLQGDGTAKRLDVDLTEQDTPGAAQRITDWQNNVYHADATDGETRTNHWGAFQNAKDVESIAKTGCT